jgi:hypothetical protein
MRRSTWKAILRAKRNTKKRTRNHMKRKQRAYSDHMKVLFGEEYNPFSFAQATKAVKERDQKLKK